MAMLYAQLSGVRSLRELETGFNQHRRHHSHLGTEGLIACAKANPGKLRMGAGSTVLQTAAEMLKYRAGIDVQVIPYKGGGPATAGMKAAD